MYVYTLVHSWTNTSTHQPLFQVALVSLQMEMALLGTASLMLGMNSEPPETCRPPTDNPIAYHHWTTVFGPPIGHWPSIYFDILWSFLVQKNSASGTLRRAEVSSCVNWQDSWIGPLGQCRETRFGDASASLVRCQRGSACFERMDDGFMPQNQ